MGLGWSLTKPGRSSRGPLTLSGDTSTGLSLAVGRGRGHAVGPLTVAGRELRKQRPLRPPASIQYVQTWGTCQKEKSPEGTQGGGG